MQQIPVLLYHSVGEDCAPAYRRWLVKPQEFDAQLHALSERGYRPITVADLAQMRRSSRPVPPRSCLITFDDGLGDFAESAMPILATHGMPATLYVVSGFVGATSRWLTDLGEGERPMLDWQGLRDLSKAGIEIGAHTVSHPELDTLSNGRAVMEIRDSKRMLEDGLGHAVTTFAYPHGYASPATRRIVEGAGFHAACRVRHALSSQSENLFALSRFIVSSEETPEKLIDLIEGDALPVAPSLERLVGIGWRAARRLRALRRTLMGSLQENRQ